MIPTQEEDILWEFYFVAEQKQDAFKGHRAAVDVIPEEEVIGVAGRAGHFEDIQQVGVLTMDIA